MGREKKKYNSGQATTYITRSSALRKLQLHLVDFRKLCILKGIYPVQPSNLKKAGRGNNAPRTYFRLKDIKFLAHEPLIWTLRGFKTHRKKVKKAVGRRDKKKVHKLTRNKPFYKLDHIIKERYPTFVDALRDLDDPLTLCYSFAILRKNSNMNGDLLPTCRRLLLEFMHYVIASRSLRKVFLSIKGIYYQASIQGQTVTWLAPYSLGFEVPKDVDFKIISIFSEVYVTLLGFVNFRLYHSLNLQYPPKLFSASTANSLEGVKYCQEHEGVGERVACLAHDLARSNTGTNADPTEGDEDRTAEDEQLMAEGSEGTEAYKKIREEESKLKKFKKLFEGCKFFISREAPREALTFVIRCFGGKVSWDKTLYIGATFNEDDETITHQIVDRPQQEKKFLSRYYIQPQWVFDCVNARMLVPVEDYFPGAELPPHLSPFAKEGEGEYIPPERKEMLARMEGKIVPAGGVAAPPGAEDDVIDDPGDDVGQEEEAFDEEELAGESMLRAAEQRHLNEVSRRMQQEGPGQEDAAEEKEGAMKGGESEEAGGGGSKEGDGEPKKKKKKKKRKPKSLRVAPGQIQKTDVEAESKLQDKQELKLREMMIKKKHRYTYRNIKAKEQRMASKRRRLEVRREKYEEERKRERSQQIEK